MYEMCNKDKFLLPIVQEKAVAKFFEPILPSLAH